MFRLVALDPLTKLDTYSTITSQEYCDIHFLYGFYNGNRAQARREYALRYPQRHLPDVRVFGGTHRRLAEGTLFCNIGGRVPNVDMDDAILQAIPE